MTNTIDIEPDPLSLRRLLGLMCLSIALILSISTFTSRRIELKKPELAVELRSLETKVEASSIQEVIPALAPEESQEVAQASEPVEAVETPPPLVQEPVKPVITPEPVKPKPTIVGSGSCEAEIYKYDWNHSTALAVARAESGLNPGARGDGHITYMQSGVRYGDSWGCFQIRYLPGRLAPSLLTNAQTNVEVAYKMYKSSGWKPWSVCKNGKVNCYVR